MNPRSTPFLVGLISLTSLVPSLAAAGGDDPAIQALSAVVREGRVYVSLLAVDTLDSNSLERLESGLPVTLEYQIELLNRRAAWFDKALESASITLDTVYDAVAREYSITRRVNGELYDVHSARDLDDLDPVLSELVDIPVMQLGDALPLEEEPEIRARLVTRRRTWLWFIPRPVASGWHSSLLVLSSDPAQPSSDSS